MPAAGIYFGLVLARVASFVAVFPLFAGRTPRTFRAALALVLAVFFVVSVGPTWAPLQVEEFTDAACVLALLREGAIGAVIGLMFSLFLLPARVAGEFVGQQIGLALSQHGQGPDAPASTLPLLFETAASLLFLGLDAHHIALAALHASFAKMQLGGSFPQMPATGLLDCMAGAHETGLLIAGPLALCLFLLAVALSLTARAAPQLSIYSIGFTLQVVAVLLALLFLMPELVQSLSLGIQRTTAALQGLMG